MVLSDDPNCIREVGRAAQFLGITLEGMQLTVNGTSSINEHSKGVERRYQ